MPQGPAAKKSYKDEDGNVILGPRNFTTKPLKKGKTGNGTTFGGNIPHAPEDFFAKKKIL